MSDEVARLATLTSTLVSFPTYASDHMLQTRERLAACVDVVRTYLGEHVQGFREEFVPEAGCRPILLGRIGDQVPRVLLCGHLDVVPAARYEATRLRSQHAWIKGRGTADMKGPIAALLDICATDPLPGLGLLLTTDEESGGAYGTKHVLSAIDWRPEVVILPDGGANMRLVTEQKGLLRLRLRASGHAVHAARPWKGRNALEQLFRGYRALRRAFPQPTSEEDWRVTISLTQIDDQQNASNVIPGFAEGVLDIRYPCSGPHGWTKDALLADLQTRLRGTSVEFDPARDLLLDVDPFQLDTQSPWVQRLQVAACDVRHGPLEECHEAGGSDARFFSREQIPTLMFQPICRDWHGNDERVSLRSLVEFREICSRFTRTALAT